MERLNRNAAAKLALQQRNQFTKEINDDRRIKLDGERIEKQASEKKQQAKKNE
jgi:hypothetical protein